jgi:hypothetical protein
MELKYILSFLFILSIKNTELDFSNVMTDLSNLETYIKEYISEKSCKDYSLTHLIVCYIRLGAYTSSEWSLVGGSLPSDLVSYIENKDKEKSTSAKLTQTYREIKLPNEEKIDFVHMFAVMNGIENGESFSSNYAHLVGWGGDTEQLLEDIVKENGDLETLINTAKNNYFRIKGGFDEADFISDLDGPILLNKKNDNNNFSDIIKNYYESDEYNNRINNFVKLTFPKLNNKSTKENFRNELFNIYSNDMFIQVLECKKGIRESGFFGCYFAGDIKSEYSENQKAAVYTVSDYLFENLKEESQDNDQEKEKESEKEKHDEKEQKDEEYDKNEKEQNINNNEKEIEENETEKENEKDKEEAEKTEDKKDIKEKEQEIEKENSDKKEIKKVNEEEKENINSNNLETSNSKFLNYFTFWLFYLVMF